MSDTTPNPVFNAQPKEIVITNPGAGEQAAYLVAPGTRVILQDVDFANAQIDMRDGDLYVMPPVENGAEPAQIILMGFAESGHDNCASSIIITDAGDVIAAQDVINALAEAEHVEEDIEEIEPAAGPAPARETVSEAPTPAPETRLENTGFQDPRIVGDGFGGTVGLISDVIDEFLIDPAFDEIDEDLQPNEPGDNPPGSPTPPQNEPPEAEDNKGIVAKCDKNVTIDVLANDSDPDGDDLTVQSFTQPANGTVVENADGTLTYTLNAGFEGEDTFTYTITDGNGGTDTATVKVEVDQNAPPDAVNDTATVAPDADDVLINVLANDSDPDGDNLTVQSFTQPGNGSVVNNGDGTFTYTPDAGFTGTDTFTYTIIDDCGKKDTAYVTVTVEEDPNQPPKAKDDCAIVAKCTENVTIDVLANDSDPDGDDLTVQSFTQPANGSVIENADGTLTYTPNAGFEGEDTFTYTITDGNGGTDTATVKVEVDQNAPPDARMDHATVGEHADNVRIDVLANDSDADGDDLSIQSFTQPVNGSVVKNADGTFTYTPNEGFSGLDIFTYTIVDHCGKTDTAKVKVHVEEKPEPPKEPPHIDFDTPLVIDLGRDGLVLQNLDESEVTFDIDGDGQKENTAWTDGSDGFLVADWNNDGQINDVTEMFGNSSLGKDGFTELAELDSNGDGIVNYNDEKFAELQIWKDENSDGLTQEGELKSLASFDITGFDLETEYLDTVVNEQWISEAADIIYENGETGQDVYDVWFQNTPAENAEIEVATLDFVTSDNSLNNQQVMAEVIDSDNADTSGQS